MANVGRWCCAVFAFIASGGLTFVAVMLVRDGLGLWPMIGTIMLLLIGAAGAPIRKAIWSASA